MLNLLGTISDRQILDIGCGSGSLTAEMLERGATVTGIDTSIAMVDLAKHRLCEKACVIQSDLTNPLPFRDATF
ncbi:class I SAM-dependent methyltransferase, partial [Micrococcus sp. SIMBA_144]